MLPASNTTKDKIMNSITLEDINVALHSILTDNITALSINVQSGEDSLVVVATYENGDTVELYPVNINTTTKTKIYELKTTLQEIYDHESDKDFLSVDEGGISTDEHGHIVATDMVNTNDPDTKII